ncbi:uncharacterized protein LOC120909103 [Rana temporaria]|uniref:uncharacterized protein LOC120909103 n=1 Tax=Rana temporaria TaxID=8407 RepID=UPI001AAD7E77|nr:uncharacterized protein LOC120909103 [Rana temporaria]
MFPLAGRLQEVKVLALTLVGRRNESACFLTIIVFTYKQDNLTITCEKPPERGLMYSNHNISLDPMPSIPALRKGDKYHVFISYSTGDSIWVSGLIHKLEDSFPDLKICFHERDFVPGKTIIDNMIECIQSSQKTVMVLSPVFVRSRWCLFEANLSMFQDCMLQKAIVPIMLKPCAIPLYLSHLTYLEADDEQFFDKLTQVLLCNNSQLAHSTLMHYQPSFLYTGKSLLTLPALNEKGKSWQPGVFASDSVPDSLRAVFDDATIYKEAIDIINDISPPNFFLQSEVCRLVLLLLLLCPISFLIGSYVIPYLIMSDNIDPFDLLPFVPIAMAVVLLMPILCLKVCLWKVTETTLVTRKMEMKTSQANLILYKNSVLAGCSSREQLHFVYVSLSQCMETFYTTFDHGSTLATNMWEKAIVTYSSEYACCLARKHFPFSYKDSPGHIEDGICFCQYVSTQLCMET